LLFCKLVARVECIAALHVSPAARHRRHSDQTCYPQVHQLHLWSRHCPRTYAIFPEEHLDREWTGPSGNVLPSSQTCESDRHGAKPNDWSSCLPCKSFSHALQAAQRSEPDGGTVVLQQTETPGVQGQEVLITGQAKTGDSAQGQPSRSPSRR